MSEEAMQRMQQCHRQLLDTRERNAQLFEEVKNKTNTLNEIDKAIREYMVGEITVKTFAQRVIEASRGVSERKKHG